MDGVRERDRETPASRLLYAPQPKSPSCGPLVQQATLGRVSHTSRAGTRDCDHTRPLLGVGPWRAHPAATVAEGRPHGDGGLRQGLP